MEENQSSLIKDLFNSIALFVIILCIIFAVLIIFTSIIFSGGANGTSYYDFLGPFWLILIVFVGPIFITACIIYYFTSFNKPRWVRWVIWPVVIIYVIRVVFW